MKYILIIGLFTSCMISAWTCTVINKTGEVIKKLEIRPVGLIPNIYKKNSLEKGSTVSADFKHRIKYIQWIDGVGKENKIDVTKQDPQNIFIEIYKGFYVINAEGSGKTATYNIL